MGEKPCDKCGEMVDEAKAFCPGCGSAIVEEKKQVSRSDFDISEHTVRLGDTMYNQMLSDMGLSISKAPNRDEKRVETVAPVVPATPARSAEKSADLSPAFNRWKWIVGIASVVIVSGILAALLILAAFWYLR